MPTRLSSDETPSGDLLKTRLLVLCLTSWPDFLKHDHVHSNSTLSNYDQAAGKRVSSAMDGKLKSIHGAWIPAIHAGMTIGENSDHVIWQSRTKCQYLKQSLICQLNISYALVFSCLKLSGYVNCLVNIRSVQASPDGQFSIGANTPELKSNAVIASMALHSLKALFFSAGYRSSIWSCEGNKCGLYFWFFNSQSWL